MYSDGLETSKNSLGWLTLYPKKLFKREQENNKKHRPISCRTTSISGDKLNNLLEMFLVVVKKHMEIRTQFHLREYFDKSLTNKTR